jgi:hypothetical protein
MTKGISINIGLNSVDPAHYQGWSGILNACEADAKDMAQLAQTRGFKSKTMLTKEGTRASLAAALTEVAATLESGDICLLTYSGHGGVLPDLNNDEDDGQDETWCLYDGQLVDDELYSLLAKFKGGVRVLVLSDSCHSGTSIKDLMVQRSQLLTSYLTDFFQPSGLLRTSSGVMPLVAYRAMPMDVATRVYLANKEYYDPILNDKALSQAKGEVVAACLLISGCQDSQLSADGAFNGLFTGKLKVVWNGGKFKGDYVAFWKTIKAKMPLDQTPNLFPVGKGTAGFEKQTPFTI